MRSKSVYLLMFAMLAGCRVAGREAVTVDARVIEDSLRALVRSTFEAIEKKDADGALEALADDVIFVGDGLMVTGKDSLLRMTQKTFSEWHRVKADVNIVRVQVLSPEAAVMNWEAHVVATDAKGNETPYGGIATAVFMKREGVWRIIQQQQCAPMPPEMPTSMKPSSRAIPDS